MNKNSSVDGSIVLSIALPVYNGENYLDDAIRSILGQTFRDFELIICDNASTDNTEAICRSWTERDPRIVYCRHPSNLGAAPNFNSGFRLAKGRYFKWAAHDDILESGYLKACIDLLDSDSRIVMAHTGTRFIDETGTVIHEYDRETGAFDSVDPLDRFSAAIDEGHYCVTVFGVVRREILAQTSLIASFVGSDRSLIAEISLRGRICHVLEPLFLSRDHTDRSVRALDIDERGAWFDASSKVRSDWHNWRMLYHHLRVLVQSPLPLLQKIAGLGRIARWAWRWKRRLLSDFRRR